MRISGVTYVSRKTHKLRNFILIMLFLFLLAAIVALGLSIYFEWDLKTVVGDIMDSLYAWTEKMVKG